MFKEIREKTKIWVMDNYFNLIVFHGIVLLMFLLRSAGYFSPYFPISVNVIITASLLVSIFVLGARSRAMFLVSLAFWLFAGLIRVFKIEVWAERTAVYTYEALVLGILMLIWERI